MTMYHPSQRCVSSIAGLLLAAVFISLLVIPQDAHAIIPGTSIPVNPSPATDPGSFTSTQWILRYVINPAARVVLRSLITSTTQQIVGWIQGDNGKNVGFVGNFQETLTRELDLEAGQFLNNLAGVNLCGNLGAFLQFSLRTPTGFRQRFGCTLTNIVNNVEGFFQNFEQGGWDSFIKMSFEGRNNPQGAYLIAADAKLQGELARFNRFLEPLRKSFPFKGFEVSSEKCTPEFDEDGNPAGQNCQTTTETKTPGQLVTDQLSKASGIGLDFAANAKDFDEALAAIVSALIGQIISASSGSSGGGLYEQSFVDAVASDTLVPQELAQSTVATEVDGTVFLAYQALKGIDDLLITKRRTLFGLRAAEASVTTPSSSLAGQKAALEAEIGALFGKKQRILADEAKLILLKHSVLSATQPEELEMLNNELAPVVADINSILTELEGAPGLASATGQMKEDNLTIVRGAIQNLQRSLTMLNDTIAEIDRVMAALPSEESESTRTSLEAQRTAVSGKIDELNAAVATLQTRENTLAPLLVQVEIYGAVSETITPLNDANGFNQSTIPVITGADAVLGITITVPAPTPAPAPPPETEPGGD